VHLVNLQPHDAVWLGMVARMLTIGLAEMTDDQKRRSTNVCSQITELTIVAVRATVGTLSAGGHGQRERTAAGRL
jgi:hypothetical protein